MKIRFLVRFGANFATKWAGQRVGQALDAPELARPTQVCAPLTSRCNFGCGFCPHPTADRHHEMSLAQWKPILAELKAWLGLFRVNFLGGEPMLHKEFFPILEHCREQGILFGVTTNGSLLTEANARRLAELEPFNVSLSLDSHVAADHDRNRGFRGSYAKLLAGLDRLVRHRVGHTRLCLRTTIMDWNLDSLVPLTDLARERGAIAAFQPVEFRDLVEEHRDATDWHIDDVEADPTGKVSGLSLDPASVPKNLAGNWVTNLDRLDDVLGEVIARKSQGWPILNSVVHLENIGRYFRAPGLVFTMDRQCRTGWEHLIILPNGSVRSCSEQPTYGNVLHQSVREIWTSQAARRHRERCATCTRTCMNMFHWKRSISEKAAMFFEYL